MAIPLLIRNRRRLDQFMESLENVPLESLPIAELAGTKERTCGICWEPYDPNTRQKSDCPLHWPGTLAASACCYSSADTNAVAKDESSPFEDMTLQTQIRLHSEILVETHVLSPNCRFNQPSNEAEDISCEGHPERVHQPVRLPCGHVFGRECILKWYVSGKCSVSEPYWSM